MSLAQTWLLCQNISPFSIITDNLPYLDYGIIQPNNYSSKFVVGLRFQGQSVHNIKMWLESYNADIYPDLGLPEVQVDLSGLGYVLKATVMSPLTTYNMAPSFWSNIPTSESSALALGSAMLTPEYEAFSTTVGLSLYVPSGQPDESIKNLRLIIQYDTLDE